MAKKQGIINIKYHLKHRRFLKEPNKNSEIFKTKQERYKKINNYEKNVVNKTFAKCKKAKIIEIPVQIINKKLNKRVNKLYLKHRRLKKKKKKIIAKTYFFNKVFWPLLNIDPKGGIRKKKKRI